MENKELTFTVNVAEANGIIQALANLPYIQVAELIEKLKAQADSQLKPQDVSISASE